MVGVDCDRFVGNGANRFDHFAVALSIASEFDFKKLAEDPVHVKYHHDVYVRTFVDLEKAGFDQVPCGSNHYSEESVGRLADFCRANIAPERLKGFLVASWRELTSETSGKDSYVRNIRAVELAAKAFAEASAQSASIK